MATIRFNDLHGVGVDMRQTDVFPGELTRSSGSTLRFSDGEHEITFTGAFSEERGDVVGALDGVSARIDGKLIYTATEAGLDAAVVWGFAETDDEAGALRYLLSRADAIRGTGFADVLTGGGGRDAIRGLDGRDRIEGGDGADRLRGDGGSDRLYGGDGADRLIGGAGEDTATGGAGADLFVFASRYDFKIGGREAIRDFSRREGDRIDLEALDANTFKTGFQRFDFIGGERFSETASELRFKGGVVSGDVQGDGEADFWIEVAGVDRLFASDFVL